MSSFHAQAINLARRYSERNENDLLQESFLEDTSESSFLESPTPSMSFSENYCSTFLERDRLNIHPPHLPKECEKFATIQANLQRRKTTREEDEAVAFAGMEAGSAVEARRARAHGSLSNAQIIRRMTSHTNNNSKKSDSWFF